MFLHSHGFLRDVRFLVHFCDENDEASVVDGNGPTTSKANEFQQNNNDISSDNDRSKDGSCSCRDSESEAVLRIFTENH